MTEIPVPDPPREEEKPTGNAELDKMISDGRKAVSEMKRLDDAIEDEKISADIRRLETVCQQIFQQVKADPAKLPQIRRFMDYYLPTTLKILNAYDRMDAAGVSGENITGTKERVENIMGTIVSAFEKHMGVEEITSEITSEVLKEVRVHPGGRFEIIWNLRDELEKLVLDLQGDHQDER